MYKILAVDDSIVTLKTLSMLLSSAEYNVFTALSGAEALDVCSKVQIDLILLDVGMPKMDGYEVCKSIKADQRTRNIPVIFLTTTEQKDYVVRGFEAGAIDYVTKPFHNEELLMRIRTHLELSKYTQYMEKMVEDTVAELRNKDKLLARQSRLATMGEMINIIAHQWRQPLSAISLGVQDIYLAHTLDELDHEYITEYKNETMTIVDRMSQTINDFRDFFKSDKEQERFTAEFAVKQTLIIMQPLYDNYGIRVNFNPHSEHFVFGYRNELEQVILILLSNAKDVLMENQIQDPQVDILVSKMGEEKITISIQDNGGGVPSDVIDKIFEPYFSTKGDNGTGIGLYIAKEIIEKNLDGELRVDNINGGARFKITLNADRI